ncbi:RNA polymerase sigma-70 factor [Aeromicrobium choanae]|uniref:RNA polymerase sigma-70 factor, ECF subfamily n=1 Tax=Aeromicrobium choanae TaxID=1736691 RepID=A0A1T4Z613_9ACTN|nr:RNA polymerase sigma-70 factor [Aeromicrobium choanae]SKB08985.1 RNA polymerase sigma-70 factor, ECF subfamily [Aeromicrobium choanae]
MTDVLAEFTAHRPLLFTVAYEMLGSAADAEDVVQEVWLRWSADDREDVQDPRAYLVRIVTRLALNRLRSLARQRESYVGPWLPEPLETVPDVADDVALAESVSTAMMLVLETLGSTERAVFVLREVFDLPYDEIAAAVDRTPDNVRQIARRARAHVAARRPRSEVTAQERTEVLVRFQRAIAEGDLQQLLDVISPDVVLISDGGGKASAARRPILGRDRVLRFLAAVMPADMRVEAVWINGENGLVIREAGAVTAIATAVVEGGVVTTMHVVRNPDKLSLPGPVRLSR